jgi:hypothetical protein
MTPRRHLALVALATAATAPLALAGDPPGAVARPPVSEVIFPAQELPLVFSHAAHLTTLDIECADCHPAALTSRSSLDNLLPGEDACAMCHAIDRRQPDKAEPGKPAARCVACHPGFDRATGFVPRLRIPPPNLKFDHRGHVVGAGIPCARCHGDLAAEGVGLATRAQLPTMDLCLECHDGKQASGRCTLCHVAAAAGRIQTEYREGSLAPAGGGDLPVHGPDFAARHAREAGAVGATCSSCHAKEYCVECHAGVVKPLDFHPADYISLHTIDARRGTPDCTACHRSQTFCVGCHSRLGVAADGRIGELVRPTEGPSDRRFHPPGWIDTGEDGGLRASRGPQHHAFEAQRNLRQCASCHRESFCTQCHSAQPGSPRINPHPADWVGSRRCEALRRRAGRMCLRCHVDLAEVSCER